MGFPSSSRWYHFKNFQIWSKAEVLKGRIRGYCVAHAVCLLNSDEIWQFGNSSNSNHQDIQKHPKHSSPKKGRSSSLYLDAYYFFFLFFFFVLLRTTPANCRFSREMFLACECRSRRAVLRQTLLDQCVNKGVRGWLLPTLSQPCGWILFGCGCGCEVLQLQPHVCAGKMTCLKLLVVAPPWPGSSSSSWTLARLIPSLENITSTANIRENDSRLWCHGCCDCCEG